MRNRFPGVCYRCGKVVAKGEGHFQIQRNGKRKPPSWHVQHADCCLKFREAEKEREALRERQESVGGK